MEEEKTLNGVVFTAPRKVYCEDCKYLRRYFGGILLCGKVKNVSWHDTPYCGRKLVECYESDEDNKSNDCPHYEKNWIFCYS